MDINESLGYKIPLEIKQKIPKYFYYAMGGELVSIFGTEVLIPEDVNDEINEYTVYGIDFVTSTSGWHEAFKATCKKLDLQWLLDYHKTLEWYDSDLFDDEIAQEIIKYFSSELKNKASSYYLYLLNPKDKNNV